MKKFTEMIEELQGAYQMLTAGYTEEQLLNRAEVDRARLNEAQALYEEAQCRVERELFDYDRGLTEAEYFKQSDDFNEVMSQLKSRLEHLEG